MEYYFKKFSTRRPQDVQFQQARNLSSPNNVVFNNQTPPEEEKNVISPRKRVNVVSFSTGDPNKVPMGPPDAPAPTEALKPQNSPSNTSEFKTPYPAVPANTRQTDSRILLSNNQPKPSENAASLFSNSNRKDRKIVYNPRSWQNDTEIETKITIKPLNESSKGPTITKTIRKSEPTFKTPLAPAMSEFDMLPSDDEPNKLKLPKLKSNNHNNHHRNRSLFPPPSSSSSSLSRPSSGNRVTFADQPELKQVDKKLMVKKSDKSLFTVVKNTSNAAQCQDKGSTQHSNDDFQYLIEGMGKDNIINTRTLSILTLANRCIDKNFRKYLKPNRCLSIISEKLNDAYLDFSLGLTTACLIYIISRERDPSQFNKESIELMMSLMKTPRTMTSFPTPNNTMPSDEDSLSTDTPDGKTQNSASLFSTSAGKFSFASRRTNLLSSGNNSLRLAKETERIRSRVRSTLEIIRPPLKKALSVGEDGKKDSTEPSSLPNNNNKVVNLFANATSVTAENPLARLKFKHIDIDKPINARDLIIESLINIGLRKTPPHFKAMIREHNVIDHFAEEIVASVDYLKDLELDAKVIQADHSLPQPKVDECSLDKLRKIFHYTRFLENMTYLEVENQTHLVRYRDGLLISQLVRIIKICSSQLPKHPSPSNYLSQYLALDAKEGEKLPVVRIYEKMAQLYPMMGSATEEQTVILDCLTRTYRLMVNLSQNEFVSHVFNSVPYVVEVTMDIVLHMPNRLPKSHRFDLLVLTLCTLVNQCQHFPENKSRIVHMELPTVPFNEGENTKKPEEVKVEKKVDSLLPWNDKRNMAQVFDEIISLFLYRDELVKSHDFEREAEGDEKPVQPTMDEPEDEPVPLTEGQTIEEAGLKWRLVKQNGSTNNNNPATTSNQPNLAVAKKSKSKSKRKPKTNGDGPVKKKKSRLRNTSTDDSDEEEALESAEEEDRSDDDEDEASEEEDADSDDEEEGVDVEFVTETKEEKDRLQEQMSSAHQHMEDSVVAAYIALLLGCIIQSSVRYTEKIRKKLPDGKFRPMAMMLAKLCSFLSLTQNIDNVAHENISRVIKNLESLDNQQQQDAT